MSISRALLCAALLCAGAGRAGQAVPVTGDPLKSEASVEVSAGTLLSVELVDPVHTGKNKAGETFRGRLLEGVWARGVMAIPPGSTLRGELTRVVPSGRVKGRSELELTLRFVEVDGSSYAVRSDMLAYKGDAHTGKTLGAWLKGAMQGALYGVLFGGTDGAIIGAGAGAAAGGVASAVTGKQDVEFARGARLLFELIAPLRLPQTAPAPEAAPKESTSKPSG